tara:strand:- start:1402 stop:2139 length:738 start_codon:yes stop_codon:yes gene_type:complete
MVNIDTVYQRVLAISNKEQRGYITPQEFNIFANQAQMDIFEQYFYDINAFQKLQSINETIHADAVDIIQEKIDHFEKFRANVDMSNGAGVGILPDYYRMGALYYKKLGQYYEIENVEQNEHHTYLRSPLTNPTVTRPIYVRYSNAGDNQQNRERRIQVYPITITSDVFCNFIARPTTVRWGYTIVNDKPLYNASASYTQHFDLHQSEETDLIVKILSIAGITIKDPMLNQYGTAEDMKNSQQEKQ